MARWAAILALALLAGCAKPAGVIFPDLPQPLVWPGPPDPPRIRYVGQLSTSADLKPRVGGLEGLGKALFGKKASQGVLSPYALCSDNAGRLFVADNSAQVVHVFDLNTRGYAQWKPPPEARAFEQLAGIAYDPAGRLLVSDAGTGVIFAFDSQGRLTAEMGVGSLRRPCGIAVDSTTRRIFVADLGAHQVVVLGHDGQVLQRLGERGIELGQFNYPTNVAVDSMGRLYVSDSLNFRIQQFSAELRPLRRIGAQGDVPGFFSQPKGIALDREDHLYVVDSRFENVQIFSPDGQLLLYFGEEGSRPGQFWLPAGIFIDAGNRIWIADCYNQRIAVFDYLPEGRP